MSSATNRVVQSSLMAFGLLLSVAACGDQNPGQKPDAGGNEVVVCSSNDDCGAGFACVSGLCEEVAQVTCNSDPDCSTGFKCDVLHGQCVPEDAPDGGDGQPDGGDQSDGGDEEETDGGTVEEGGPCDTRYDCPTGLICKSKKCVRPADGGTCSQDIDCPRGEICNFSQRCEPGCVDGRDCESPELCHPQKFVCETCSLTNPCPAGESCLGGECLAAVACSTAQDCVNAGVDGAVCSGGFCSNCESHGDCAVDPYKADKRLCGLDGLCKKVECNDENCRQDFGPRAYCNTATNECGTRECMADSDCLQSGTVCNLATYECVADNPNCDTALCQSECAAQGLTCNVAACRCGGGGGPGIEGDPCATDLDCAAGYMCGLGICTEGMVDGSGGPCDSLTCALGGMFGGGCFGAASGRPCDPIGCFMGAMMGASMGCL